MTNNTDNETLLDNDIPEKFKDAKTGTLKTDVLLNSYKELEKKMSGMPRVPANAEDYKITCNHGLFSIDQEMNKELHARGFSNEQVQFIYDLAAEKMIPMVIEMAREFHADFEADREIEKLINHFGGVEQWQEISRQLLAFGQKALPADVLDSLSSSYEGVIALHNMMQGQEPAISHNENRDNNNGATDLHSMMRDPKYWRDKDPSFVAKVTEGFRKIYGESE